jgi:hypothetical protein
MKKVKLTNTILEKKKKHVEKNYSNPQCFKEKNYKAKFLISSILKKIKSTKIILKKKSKKQKKKEEKNEKKNIWGKLKLNSQPAQY